MFTEEDECVIPCYLHFSGDDADTFLSLCLLISEVFFRGLLSYHILGSLQIFGSNTFWILHCRGMNRDVQVLRRISQTNRKKKPS